MIKKKTKLGNPKSISKLKNDLWYWFSRYYRLKNSVNGIAKCYTCDAEDSWKKMQTGHYESRKHSNSFIDEDNVKIQCLCCNVFKHGNYPEYARRLIRDYGDNILEDLHIRAVQPFKWDRAYLDEQIKHYKTQCEYLEG